MWKQEEIYKGVGRNSLHVNNWENGSIKFTRISVVKKKKCYVFLC